MTIWNGNLNFYALEIKGLKQGYTFQNRPFYISFVLFNTIPSMSEYSKKKSFQKKSILPTYHNFFQGVTWTTNIFFIWRRFFRAPTSHNTCIFTHNNTTILNANTMPKLVCNQNRWFTAEVDISIYTIFFIIQKDVVLKMLLQSLKIENYYLNIISPFIHQLLS